MKPLYVFLDTNIFLHYKSFDQIRWTEVFGTSRVILVITPIVIRELDERKDQHKLSAIRDRARTALKKIEQSSLDPTNTQLRDGVELEYAKEPTVDFEHYSLRREISDDHLIASCLTYDESELDRDLVLVSGDTGPRLKARQHGFKALPLPDRYELPSALDAVEKEKKQLQRRIQQLENRFPKLGLAFADGENQLKTAVQQPFTMSEEEKERQISNIKYKHSKQSIPSKSESEQSQSSLLSWAQAPSIASQFAGNLNEIPPNEIQRYNSELDQFYYDYETFLQKYVQNRNLQRRTICLDIRLFNQGTAPSKDIDVFMHFPDGFDLYDEDTKPQTPERPDPPTSPRNRSEMMYPLSNFRDWSHLPRTTPYVPIQGNVSSPEIKKSNSYEVSYEVQSLKQHMDEPCEPLYVSFNSFESVKSFGIEYRINAADLPDEVTGTLHVVVARS